MSEPAPESTRLPAVSQPVFEFQLFEFSLNFTLF